MRSPTGIFHWFHRFFLGFSKAVVADTASVFVDATYNNYNLHPGSMLLAGTVLFAIQIYCDFSGYSDMAIGIARMLGFRFKENFAIPYFSKDITEFWRRWHMSLSSWLRDYLYISLAATGWENGRHTEPDADHAVWRFMARRLLELCDLGRHQRFISII